MRRQQTEAVNEDVERIALFENQRRPQSSCREGFVKKEQPARPEKPDRDEVKHFEGRALQQILRSDAHGAPEEAGRAGERNAVQMRAISHAEKD